MSQLPDNETRGRLLRELAAFFGLTFLLSWTLFGAIAYAPAWVEQTFGVIHTPEGMVGDRSPLWYLAVYAPSLSALLLTLGLRGGDGIRQLLGRYVRGFRWHGLLLGLAVFPTLALVGRALLPPHDLSFGEVGGLIAAYAGVVISLRLLFDPGPIGEELGWRGYALPRLIMLMAPFWAAVFLGAVWAIWHLNAFVGPNATHAKYFSFLSFSIGCIAATVVMTWLYVRYRGNLIICGVATHLALNAMLDSGISRLEMATIVAMSAFALAIALLDPTMRPFRPRPIPAEALGGVRGGV